MLSKSFLYILIGLATGIILCTSKKKDFVFSLEGKLKNIYPGSVVLYKATDLNKQKYDIVDTLSVNADSTFLAFYNLEPQYYILSIYDSMRVKFIADSGQQIKLTFPEKGKYSLSGSVDTELFEEYERFRTDILKETVYPIRGKLYKLLDKNNPSDAMYIEKLAQQVVIAEENYRDTLINAVKKMGTSIAIYPTILRWNGDKHMTYYEKLAAAFIQKHKGLEVANLISEKIRILKQVSIGGKVSEIVAKNTSGVDVSLYNNLGKYTLIDFWGSWCAPCRAESEYLTKVYNQYNDVGFKIFGFAVENDKEKWINAIKKDNRNWINVSTLNSYKNEISAEYAITSLPKNFLVDENGIILAKDLHKIELEEKLANLFSNI